MIKKLTIIGIILTLLLSASSSVTQGSPDITTPTITFLMDDEQNTLTVTFVDQPDIPWTDIEIVGGLCAIPFVGYVEVGDIIECSGTVSLRYVPNGAILCTYRFAPDITFKQNNEENKLIVEAIYQMNTPWSDITSIGIAGSYTCNIPTSGFVETGDAITDCSGVFSLKYVPTGKVIGTFDFTDSGEETPEIKYGWVYGQVLLKSQDTTYPGKNITIRIYPSEKDISDQSNEVTINGRTYTKINLLDKNKISICLTNENGEFTISNLQTGTYTIEAIKNKLYKSTKFIEIKENQGTEVNFIIEISETRLEIEKSINSGNVAGEINIQLGNNSEYEHEIIIYDSVNITPVKISEGEISLIVSGDEYSTGKTIAITVDQNLFGNMQDLTVKYDGESIEMADNISDVLNPNNDGLHAEYLITLGANGIEILISIPHFSEHEITVLGLAGELIETLGGITAVLLYITMCAVAAVVFIGTIYIRRRF